MNFLEEDASLVFLNQTVKAVNYSNRIPATYGSKLGIIVDEENIPVNESTAYTSV